ncbi:bifunctional UDP-sugar hydrolase/5'-nucleotidase [Vibrio sp. 10N.261.51.F12]|uniref:bifunctional metallophosphatase/5'-nucleotidase n=1 Tax=Vibrio sp. 10N.261.51.F12 TaxID=3229679 RepID=UPI003553A29B
MMIKANKPLKLTIAHINDTHSYFEPTSLQLNVEIDNQEFHPFVSAGGFARIKTRVEQLKSSHNSEDFLFLHAGDCFQGTLYFSLFKGEANSDLLNALELDAMTLGNHELDMGNEPVGQFVRSIHFPFLAGNWNLSEEGDKTFPINNLTNVYHFDPLTRTAQWIEKVVNGETVAIFGLSIDKMADIANPDSDTVFENAITTASNTVAAIQRTGTNKIILLSHLGYEADLELAEQVQGIGLIIGGHSHVLQGDFSDLGLGEQDQYGVRVKQTYVVQAGFHAMTLGHCDITFDSDGVVSEFSGQNELLVGRRIFMDVDCALTNQDYDAVKAKIQSHNNVVQCRKDEQVKSILRNKYQPRVKALQQTTITKLGHALRHVRVPDAHGGSEIAPFVAESFHHAMTALGHRPEFAIHNAGGVRNSLNAGDVSVADIAGKLLPFAVPIGVYTIQGCFIPLIIEGAINNAIGNGVVGTGSGSYPYTFQLEFQYDKEAPMGERVSGVFIEGRPLDVTRIYTGTSSAYTMKGKEGYDAILNMEDEGIVTNWSMSDCFIKLLKDKPEHVSSARHYRNI